ncbi:MAG: hypothetical protein AAFO94_16515, partial [Bacteroidota bacterium]
MIRIILTICLQICVGQLIAQQLGLGLQLGNVSNCPSFFTGSGSGTASTKNVCLSFGVSLYQRKASLAVWRLRTNLEIIDQQTDANVVPAFAQVNVTELRSRTNRQTNFMIAPGVFWEPATGKFRPRAGFELPIVFRGKRKNEQENINTTIEADPSFESVLTFTNINSSEQEAWMDFGLAVPLGLAIFLSEKFSISAEYIPTIYYNHFEITQSGKSTVGFLSITRENGVEINRDSDSNTQQFDFGV